MSVLLCAFVSASFHSTFACSLGYVLSTLILITPLNSDSNVFFIRVYYAFQPNARVFYPFSTFCTRFSTFFFFALIFSIHFALKMYSPETSDSIFRTSKPYHLSSCQFIHALGKLKCQCWVRSLFFYLFRTCDEIS